MELIALADAQSVGPLSKRHCLERQYKSRRDPSPVTRLHHIGGTDVLIGDNYYNTLLRPERIKILSGVYDQPSEPTMAWKELPVEEKGVFFMADSTFYGIVMPHAKVNVSPRDGGNRD